MRRSRTALFLFVFLCISASCSGEQPGEDMQKLQGTWTIVSWTVGGDLRRGGDEINGKIIIDGNKLTRQLDMTLVGGVANFRSTFKIDSEKKPKEIDLTVSWSETGPVTMKLTRNYETTVVGIYELDGDQLKISHIERGKRPSDFTSKESDRREVFVLKREPPAKK